MYMYLHVQTRSRCPLKANPTLNGCQANQMTKPYKNEYDQKIPQSHTVDKPTAPWGRARTLTATKHQENNESETNISLFPIKMIAKLDGHKVLNNKTKLRTPTNNESNNKQQNNHRLTTESSPSHRRGGWGLNLSYWYQTFALDSVVV